MFDYRLVEAFAAVLAEQGFERAGQKLGLTQSAVSQRIRQLEAETGSVLIIRDSPPRPSPAGERLLRHFRQVRTLEDEARAELASEPAGRFKRLVIGINADSLATWFLDACLPILADRDLCLDLRVDDQERTLRFLKSGEACACLSSRAASLTGCRSLRLGAMDYRLCASPAFRQRWFPGGFTAAAAARAPIFHFNHDDRLQIEALERCFGEAALRPPAHYLPSTERIFQAVLAGLGSCMIPVVQARTALADGRLVELAPPARVSVELYWHRWSLATAALDDFSRELVRQAAVLLSSGDPGGYHGPS
jgi:LysR family transcriptional regulator (chromosome initiation inhibitor)